MSKYRLTVGSTHRRVEAWPLALLDILFVRCKSQLVEAVHEPDLYRD